MKNLKKLSLLFFLSLLLTSVASAQLTQTIRGTVYDVDSKTPLIGANVYIPGTHPILGAVTDINGKFRIENVPVGRISLKVSSLGYEDKTLSNLLIASAKETVLEIDLPESLIKLEEAVVSARKNKSEVLNSMATVSSKTFSVEETNRYAGSLNDPARMVSAYAGVMGDPEGNNDIVVRGNSPKGILWRLEGIDIPNPNHFANNGSTGGPVNTLNPAMLSNSDFFSGAFAPEYGNALSGVFDVKFREGNNEKREYSFSAGVLGTDIAVEGPFKEGYDGSYLANYRYSSLALLTSLGVLDFGGVPEYQDASFKIALPTSKYGKFTLFGLGGISNITATDEEDGINYGSGYMDANLGIVGMNHVYALDGRTYIKSSVSASTAENRYSAEVLNNDGELFEAFRNKMGESAVRFSTVVNRKIDSRLRIQTGATLSLLNYSMLEEMDALNTGIFTTHIDANGNTQLLQAFTSWKYRVHEDVTMVAGLHFTHFMLNNNIALEPRIGLKWQFTPRQNFTLGFGNHSKVENISTYMASTNDESPNYTSNKNLELTKAMHFVVGYGNLLGENLHFKTEVYYQHLYDVPVENDPTSAYSILNSSQEFTTRELVNEGTGRNYGVELSLERFFYRNFYYLATTSLYKSKYTAMDGIERNSRYDANYAANLVLGKEFKLGNGKKKKMLGLNTKVSFLGGNRYTPIDLEASREAGHTKYHEDQPYAKKGEDVFFINLGLTYRVDRKKTTHEFKLDVTNITNHQAVTSEYYSETRKDLETGYQLPMVPNIIYTLKF